MAPESNERPESITISEVVELTMNVKQLLEISRKHEKALYGNGDNEKGLSFRVLMLERFKQTVETWSKPFLLLLAGELFALAIGLLTNRIDIVFK